MPSLAYNSFLLYFMIAAVQGFIVAFIIVLQQPRKRASIYLGILIFLISLSVLHGVLEDSIHAFNGRFPVPMNFGMLYGPIALFHFQSLMNPGFRLHRRQLWHFVPSLIFDVLFFVMLFAYARANMEWAYEHIILIRLLAFSVALLTFFHILIYGLQIYKQVRSNPLFPTPKTIGWSRTFGAFWVAGILIYLVLLPIVYLSIEREDYGYNLFFVIGMFDTFFIYWAGYSYLFKYRTTILGSLNRAQLGKYSEEELLTRKRQLKDVIESDQTFMDRDLNLSKLSERLGWPAKEVSWMIGEHFETNFNEFVNKYRVHAFLDRLKEPESQKFSIDGLAREVGFNSKASFYRAFKKTMGKTPTEYLSDFR